MQFFHYFFPCFQRPHSYQLSFQFVVQPFEEVTFTNKKMVSSKNLKQVCVQVQVAKLKIAKSNLISKFLMPSSAAIFDLNLKSPMTSNCNYLGCSPENFSRCRQDISSWCIFWQLHGHNLFTHSCIQIQIFHAIKYNRIEKIPKVSVFEWVGNE